MQVFPSHCIQLHGEGKEVAFLTQSSLFQLVQDPRGCLEDAMAKQLGRVALAFPGHGGVCAW